MGDSFVTIIAIFLAAMLMFVFPLMSVSEKSDNISQLTVQTATTDFVDKVRTTGELTLDDYDKYIQTITSTGNAFDVELMVQIMDENIGVKTTQAETTKIGENIYYNLYTSQLESVLKDNKKHKITLKAMGKWQIAQVVNLQTWVRILLNSAIICFIIKKKN